jgi:Helix-turn-helix domain/Protein tyrosine and serine/threonine kinase
MPWHQTDPVNERLKIVADARRGHLSRPVLCEKYGICRKTGYELLSRYEADGPGGLSGRSRARLEHPNIARVLDAGATSSGSPFFVMEPVRGAPISKFCEERKVPAHERMQLFVQVCHALQRARQMWIIHRDIELSNERCYEHRGMARRRVAAARGP